MPFTDPIITKFEVDDRGYLQGLDRITGGLEKTEKSTEKADKAQKKLLASFNDYKAAASVVTGAIGGAVSTFDRMIERTGKLQGMMRAQAFSLGEAQKATAGLISKYDLLEAANRGVALGVDLNAKKFADLARAAAVVSQRMGTDVNQAIGDLMTGLGRQSRMILDNLGIIVKVEQANKDYATSLGKTTSALTESEKRLAFQAAALKELRRVSAGAALQTDTLAAGWQQFKTSLENSLDLLAGGKGGQSTIGYAFKFWGQQVENLVYWLKGTNRELAQLWEKLRVDRNKSFSFKDPTRGEGSPWSTDETEARPAWLSKKGQKKGRRAPAPAPKTRAPKQEPNGMFEQAIAEADVNAAMMQTENLRELNFLQRENAAHQAGMAQMWDEQFQAQLRAGEEAQRYNSMLSQLNDGLNAIALGGMANFASGMWNAIDAAVHGEKSIGDAIMSLTKQTLMGVAQQATVKAVFELAEAFSALAATWGVPNPKSTFHFLAAAKYGAIAGVMGTIGVAIPGGGGGGGRSSSRGVSRGVGGPASGGRSGGGGPLSLTYNINTVMPPDEDELAVQLASGLSRARAMGLTN